MAADAGITKETRYGEYAGFATRLVAFVIDIAILVVIVTVIGTTTSLLTQFLGFNQNIERLLGAIAALITMSINVGYFMIFWMLVGMTPGMRIMGLLVIAEDGGRMTIGMAIRRYIGLFLSAILLLGYLWVLIDERRQGFHDKLAGTLVIYDWPDDVLFSQTDEKPERRAGAGLAHRRQYRPPAD